MIIIKLAASAFSCAYTWVFYPSLVSHSISPKNLSDGGTTTTLRATTPTTRPTHSLSSSSPPRTS
jgi:hypothetical protein